GVSSFVPSAVKADACLRPTGGTTFIYGSGTGTETRFLWAIWIYCRTAEWSAGGSTSARSPIDDRLGGGRRVSDRMHELREPQRMGIVAALGAVGHVIGELPEHRGEMVLGRDFDRLDGPVTPDDL